MKKEYEKMEAYKVEFNATEQVAAAGCTLKDTGGKYGEFGTDGCALFDNEKGEKFATTPGDAAVCLEDEKIVLNTYAA